jgi:hypothetical protein
MVMQALANLAQLLVAAYEARYLIRKIVVTDEAFGGHKGLHGSE